MGGGGSNPGSSHGGQRESEHGGDRPETAVLKTAKATCGRVAGRPRGSSAALTAAAAAGSRAGKASPKVRFAEASATCEPTRAAQTASRVPHPVAGASGEAEPDQAPQRRPCLGGRHTGRLGDLRRRLAAGKAAGGDVGGGVVQAAQRVQHAAEEGIVRELRCDGDGRR